MTLGVVLAALGAALAGCDAPGSITGDPAASVTITPSSLPRLLVGDTVQLAAIALDDHGRQTSATITWATSQPGVATISATGLLIVAGNGPLTVTASAGAASRSLSTTVADPLPTERFAFALANQPTAASYGPDPDLSYNGFANGPPGIQVTRSGTGSYRVTFRGLGLGGLTEVVLTSSFGTIGIKCAPDRWGRLSNARDLDALVLCTTAAGLPADSRFTILVVGQGSIPGLLAFSRVNATAPAGGAATGAAWSSAGVVSATNLGVGRTDLKLGLPIQVTDNVNTFVTVHGSTPATCRSLGRNTADVLSVRCTSPDGSDTNADFAALAISEGRPNRRFAMAYNDQGFLATWTLHPTYQKTSNGMAVLGHRHGPGSYSIVFSGWGDIGPETFIVSAFVEAAFCTTVSVYQVVGSTDQNIDVTCYASDGTPVDSRFTILVLE